MATIILIIIYIAFISLGLPDAILGSAWPVIHQELNVSISFAGIITMIISGGTIVSSLLSGKVIRKFGTGKVTMASVFMTAIGLIGICYAPGYFWLCILGVPLGVGAGAVDSALNNFVALHYKARHMNWLHCFWGIGATAGPLLMSLFLAKKNGWRMGYLTIGMIQTLLVICLAVTLPVWKKFERSANLTTSEKPSTTITTLLTMKGAKSALVAFFCYCSVEATTGLWGSSFLVTSKGIDAERAAQWISLYYLGITIGRFLAGFLAIRLNNKKLILLGHIICICGIVILIIPFSIYFSLMGLIFIGLGCAPIFPAMLHETPNRFGSDISQGIMGIQMATAYIGTTSMPPLFGFVAGYMGFNIFPFFLMLAVASMFVSTIKANKVTDG